MFVFKKTLEGYTCLVELSIWIENFNLDIEFLKLNILALSSAVEWLKKQNLRIF